MKLKFAPFCSSLGALSIETIVCKVIEVLRKVIHLKVNEKKS